MIDFGTTKPEQVRHIPKKTDPVNWDALELVVRTTTGTELQKKIFKRKFFKAIRANGVEAMTPWFRYHYCCARLALGDFSDYWGWEFRGLNAKDEGDDWAARLFWEETWLAKWGGGEVRRLLVLGEQGIGDQVFFASILPEAMVRCHEVIYECDDRLHALLERSLPGLQCRSQLPFEDRRTRHGPIDAFIPAAELMRMFRRSIQHFPGKPFLRPNKALVEKFERYRGRTGIAWYGRQGAIEPNQLDIENPLSVQYLKCHPGVERPVVRDFTGIEQPVDFFSDIESIVALCSVLDRVVTVPQSVHHFAAAVGTKVDIITPPAGSGEAEGQIIWDRSPLYNGGKLPWYKGATVYHSLKDWKHEQAQEAKQKTEKAA